MHVGRLVTGAGCALLVAGALLAGAATGGRADTTLTGSWTGGGHKLTVTGTLEGGFAIAAGESWTIIGCPISAGDVLSRYAPKGGGQYDAMYLWTENENGKCSSSTRGPETVSVSGSATSLTISGCGYAYCGSISRPAPPAATTRPAATTTAPPATTTRPAATTTRPRPATTPAADTEPPVVVALGGKGKPGAKIRLSYRVSDDSGRTKDTVAVMRGSETVAGPKTSQLGPAVQGKVYWVNWTAPATPPAQGVAYRFCVYAADAAGNRSATSCAPISIAGDSAPPQVTAFAKGTTLTASRDVLRFTVEDDSGRATWHATVYQGGTAIDTATQTGASGRQQWSVLFASDLTGPLYYCVWAEDAAGNRSRGAPHSDCAWITLVVPVDRVANTCGGGVQKWDVGVIAQNYFGNVHRYFDSGSGYTYEVDFGPACNTHDAGYGGHAVRDLLRGGRIVDFHSWTRKQVDDKFLADMRLLCNRGIPERAADALAKCVEGAAYYALPVNHLIGAETLYGFVRRYGDAFFDSDLTKPGMQTWAETKRARAALPSG